MRAPLPCQWSSRLPPWRPARPFVSVSPSVATPTTPTIGLAGKRTRSFISIQPSSTRNMRVTGDSTWSISWPKPGIRQAKPNSIGRTSRISAIRESPGHGLELRAEGPDDLVASDPVTDGGCHLPHRFVFDVDAVHVAETGGGAQPVERTGRGYASFHEGVNPPTAVRCKSSGRPASSR